jgi:ribose/xylose/arabinose/galactoside ABC-type transport system permease subunit
MSLQRLPLIATLATFVLICVLGGLRYDGFLSWSVMTGLLKDNAFLGICSVGMTFVILSGGIDLSVGSVIGMTSILTAVLVERLGLHPALAVPLVIACGTALGAAHGWLIREFGLPPFLVTLAGMFFARGLGYVISLESIPLQHAWYQALSSHAEINAWIFLAVVLAGTALAGHTRFGRATYALGGNVASARLMGLPVGRTLLGIYSLSGFCSALAGVVYTLYTSSGNASAAAGLELDAIAAVVIGGTLLTGGVGHVLGTFVGVLILGAIQTAITFEATLSSWWTRIAIGSLVFVFITLQKLITRMNEG